MGSCQSCQSYQSCHQNNSTTIGRRLSSERPRQLNFVRELQRDVRKDYTILDRIGDGSISTIYRVRRKRRPLPCIGHGHPIDTVTTTETSLTIANGTNGNKQSMEEVHEDCHSASPTQVDDSLGSFEHDGDDDTDHDLFALKQINVSLLSKQYMDELRNEIRLLQQLDHPNIIRLYDVYRSYPRIRMPSFPRFRHFDQWESMQDRRLVSSSSETLAANERWSMILDYCRGGHLGTRSPYTEHQAALVVLQLVEAVAYLHDHHILHRDIKIQNCLFESSDLNNFYIKLIDLGLAVKYLDASRRGKILVPGSVGTIQTMSPEVFLGVSGPPSDMWSVGVVAYYLLSATYPFYGERREDFAEHVLAGEYRPMTGPAWQHVSAQARDFVDHLLRVDPLSRCTASQALRHTWLAEMDHNDSYQHDLDTNTPSKANITIDVSTPQDSCSINSIEAARLVDSTSKPLRPFDRRSCSVMPCSFWDGLKSYQNSSEFRKLALQVVARQSAPSEILQLRNVFYDWDTDRHGAITLEELMHVLRQQQHDSNDGNQDRPIVDANRQDVEQLFRALDLDRSGTIGYTEFLAATLETQGPMDDQRVSRAFEQLDVDGNGYITADDLRIIFLPDKPDEKYIRQLIQDADVRGDGMIDLEEFQLALLCNIKRNSESSRQ